jgi:two-component system vancomycin resistance associated response regulator VraR
MRKYTTVVVVDDDMISRGYMKMFIKPSRRYQIAACLSLADDLPDWCFENGPPDLIVMDIMMMNGRDGLTVSAQIKKRWPETKIILTTSMADVDCVDRAREIGVNSFWFKTYPELPLLEVMDRTVAGENVYPEHTPEVSLGELRASELTFQQRRVLRLLTEGLSNREIAERLVVSASTVKTHLDDIMDRTGIHSRTALVAQVVRLGLVDSTPERQRTGEEQQTKTEKEGYAQ